MIYADYAASSPMMPRALNKLTETARDLYGNPSSMHQAGEEAAEIMEKARRQCAALIHADPGEIVFTSGGTESDNLALRGCGRRRIAVSAIEHPAVLRTAEALAAQGRELIVLPADSSGVVPAVLPDAVDGDTVVSLMLANNETGVLQPVKEMAALAHERGAVFHCDAVQGVGHIPVDVREIGCDLMSVSAHKLGGPKGIGFLYVRDGVHLDPILTGGGQERGLRSGTESVPLIASLGEACAEAAERMNEDAARLSRYRDEIERELMLLPDVRRNGEGERLPGICSLSFGGIGGEAMTLMCGLRGLCVSSGSACHSGDERPSHVLCAMGVPEKYLTSALRISLGWNTEESEIPEIVRCVGEAAELLRSMSQ